MCEECYSDENRITPLLNPLDCLENHTQYICGTCGRCICIEHDPKYSLQGTTQGNGLTGGVPPVRFSM